MPRQLKITREQALEIAMKVFWARGYQGTSIDDLQEAMGIQRGSFYTHFLDKKSLFLEVLDHYKSAVVEKRRAQVRQSGSPLRGLMDYFNTIVAHLSLAPENAGCLNTNTAAELGIHDQEICLRISSNINEWVSFWAEIITLCQREGELSPSLDPRQVALSLVALTQGLNIMGKVNPDGAILANTAKATLQAILGRNLVFPP